MPNNCRRCADNQELGLLDWRCPEHAANWVAKQTRRAAREARYRGFLEAARPQPPKEPDLRLERILRIRARIDSLPARFT